MKNLIYLMLTISMLMACVNDSCDNVVCYNGGECIDGTCNCQNGYTGEDCSISTKQIKAIRLNGEIIIEYEYEENGYVSKMTTDQTIGIYNYETDIITIVFTNTFLNSESISRYTKISSDSLKRELISDGELSPYYSLYTEFSQTCSFEKEEFIFDQIGTTISTKTINFVDNNCSNDSEIVLNQDNSIIMSSSLTMDDKNYHSYSTLLPFLQYSGLGNVISRIEKEENGNIDEVNSYTSTFTYDEENYPTEEIRTPINSGDKDIYTYEYY